MDSDHGAFLIEMMLHEKIKAVTVSLEISYNFPGEPKTPKFYEDDKFGIFLRKLDILLSLQLFFSLIVLELDKQISLKEFSVMYMKTQKEIVSLLYEMYYAQDERGREIILDYTDIPRLEEEIDTTSNLAYDKWTGKSSLSDKEMLGIVEQVGDSVKDPVKKVFGGAMDVFARHILRRKIRNNEKLSVKHQGRINSGFKYLDEFANIAMRLARGGI
ncbi:MAG TPA: hypothetical protein VJ571_06565 [Candidatus Nitrosotalea sp.]|nr:hypothetical protein [Candidatus Nitrosotalea sp.]